MSRSYKTTGINLKAMPMGETDRLLTILTVDHGLVRVIVPGARKHKSRLGGRSSQFVVNEVLIVQGKSLGKLVQAETLRSFPGLSGDLARLTASQYLAELVLCQALSDQPQGELFALLIEHLQRLEQAVGAEILGGLSQGIFQLLMAAGVAPELHQCCVSQMAIAPNISQADWHVGFSPAAGGVVSPDCLHQAAAVPSKAKTTAGRYAVTSRAGGRAGTGRSPKASSVKLISAQDLVWLQHLSQAEPVTQRSLPGTADGQQTLLGWQRIERLLRQYAEYHFDRSIRSATLMDTCFPLTVSAK